MADRFERGTLEASANATQPPDDKTHALFPSSSGPGAQQTGNLPSDQTAG